MNPQGNPLLSSIDRGDQRWLKYIYTYIRDPSFETTGPEERLVMPG